MHAALVVASSIGLSSSLLAQVQWTEFPARTSSAMSEDSSGATPRIVGFGGVSLEGTMLGDTQVLATTSSTPSWQPLPTTGTPPPTSKHAMANLPGVGVVLFGGQTDATTLSASTWIFHGDSWSQAGGSIAPTPRTGHAMALDESRNRIVLYGGKDANNVPLTDTWEFDGANWTQVFPPMSPGPMIDHSMAFHPASNTVILVERWSGMAPWPQIPALPAWRYDGVAATWTSMPGPSSSSFGPTGNWRVVRCPGTNTVCVLGGLADMPVNPQKLVGNAWVGLGTYLPHRTDAKVAYDISSDRVYIVGGMTTGFFPAHTTIVWNGATATFLQEESSPDGRAGHSLVTNTQDQRVYLVGGNNSYAPQYGYSPFEVWRRESGQWEQVAAFGPSSPLGAAFDSVRNRLVTLTRFGTWEWDGTNWFALGSGAPTQSVGMAFDLARGRTIVFDGAATWDWNGSGWSQLQPQHSPPTRAVAAMAYDPASDSVLLFGGSTQFGATLLSDTWRWDGVDWIQQTTGPTPPPGEWIIATDPLRRRVVIARGAETWEWDGATWLQRAPLGNGPPNGAMAFDPQANKLVVFANSGSTFEYGPVHAAVSAPFGAGCPGSGPPRSVTATRLPWFDDIAQFTVDIAPNPSIGFLGFSNTLWSGIPLPADLTLAGMPNCNLYTSLDWIEFLPHSTWHVAIPPLPGSVGLQFYVQALVPDAGAGNPFLATMSNAIVNVIGEK